MTTFDDRERAFETQFVLAKELEFKALARRDRALGEWAGSTLGKTGEELKAYAESVVRADLEEPGEEDVLRKLVADLHGKVGEADIRAKMDALLVEARAAVLASA